MNLDHIHPRAILLPAVPHSRHTGIIESGKLRLNEDAHDLLTMLKRAHAAVNNRCPATRARENVVELWLLRLFPFPKIELQVHCFPLMTWF